MMVFTDEFSNFFSIFCHFAGAWLPEHSSSSTETQPALKYECHSKTTVWFKECSPKASQSISRVSLADLRSFMQNLMQTRSILPSFTHKTKHEVKKALV
jgi:hypothetical protein